MSGRTAGARRSRAGHELYAGSTREIARRLLGAILVHETSEGCLAGRIVEVEAYLSRGDPASHSHAGPTARNRSMFLAAGHAYVYRIYGLHHCFNVVTGEEGVGEAVLVRALEPLEGIERMAARRGRDRVEELCNGPAKLVRALAIEPRHDGADLVGGALRLELDGARVPRRLLRASPRIGITKAADLPLRYTIAGSPWASRP